MIVATCLDIADEFPCCCFACKWMLICFGLLHSCAIVLCFCVLCVGFFCGLDVVSNDLFSSVRWLDTWVVWFGVGLVWVVYYAGYFKS